VVEAAGVELIRVLTARNLLILGTATTAKNAPLPDPLYVYCTTIFSHCDQVQRSSQAEYPTVCDSWKKELRIPYSDPKHLKRCLLSKVTVWIASAMPPSRY
jgi:hypothetical protein